MIYGTDTSNRKIISLFHFHTKILRQRKCELWYVHYCECVCYIYSIYLSQTRLFMEQARYIHIYISVQVNDYIQNNTRRDKYNYETRIHKSSLMAFWHQQLVKVQFAFGHNQVSWERGSFRCPAIRRAGAPNALDGRAQEGKG